MKSWHERVADPLVAEDIVSGIANGGALVRHFGRWPDFEDAELLSIHFDRGNHMAVSDRGDWDHRVPPILDAAFYVFDVRAAVGASQRPAEVVLRFSELHEIQIERVGHQNPIQGLGIRLEQVDRLRRNCLRVDWGGAALGHEVSLLCESIAVRSISPREPEEPSDEE